MRQKIKVPFLLRLKVYSALLFTLISFLGLYYSIYYYFDIVIFIASLIPLFIIFFKKSKLPGIKLKKKDHPKLFDLFEEVAQVTKTSLPKEVYLTPDSGIFVTGAFTKKISIGIAALRELSVDEFKAIVAHEFGHFYGNDTIVGGFFQRVGRSLEMSSHFGKKVWDAIPILNVAIIGVVIMVFFKIYSYIFHIVNFTYSRQIEYRADYVAAQVAGNNNFRNGLLKYVAFSKFFNVVAYNRIINLLSKNKAYVNVYDVMHKQYLKQDIKKNTKIILETSIWNLFSTHPPLKSRINAIEETKIMNSSGEAITLFNDFKKLEEKMTGTISHQVYDHIKIKHEYDEAVKRMGKCRYCQKQFNKLDKLLKHENDCKKSNDVVKEVSYHVCKKCNHKVDDQDNKCKNCKAFLAVDGAVKIVKEKI
jgi:Zn-dependent protease with chaperone function